MQMKTSLTITLNCTIDSVMVLKCSVCEQNVLKNVQHHKQLIGASQQKAHLKWQLIHSLIKPLCFQFFDALLGQESNSFLKIMIRI